MSGGEYDPTVLPASNGPEYPQSEYPPYPSDPYYGYSDGYGYQPPGYWNYPPNDAYGGYAPETYPAYPPNESTYPAGTDAAYYDGGKVPAMGIVSRGIVGNGESAEIVRISSE